MNQRGYYIMKQKYYTASFHNGGRKEDVKDTKGTVKSVKFQANREHNIRDEEYCKNQEHIGFKNKTDQEHEEWAKTHILLDEKPEDAYERIFGEAVKKYDEKQKRADRKIGSGKNYYEKIKKSKNKVPVYEFIITLGNKDNLPDNPEEVRQIYIEALNSFRTRNPNFEVIGAYYHDDESRDDGKGGKVQGAPHLHVDYIPVSRNRWQNFIDEQNKKESLIDKLSGKEIEKKTRVNGLDVENSLTEALAAQGYESKELDVSVIEKKFGIHISEKHFKNPERQAQYEEFMNSRVNEKGNKIKTRLLTAQMQWIKNERDCLIRLFKEHGYKIKNPGEHRPHLETQDFIESKDMNIQERNLELYNELSSKIDFVEAEEKELSETKNALLEKEKILSEKEEKLNQKAAEQNARDEILDSKTKIVEEAEGQLEEARQINAKTEVYLNNIDLIKTALYDEIKFDVDKDYKPKYQELNEYKEALKKKETELDLQKTLQDETELQQQQKAKELSEREENVSNLEAEKKAVEEKEKVISAREEQVKIDTEANKEKEEAFKEREKNLAKEKAEIESKKFENQQDSQNLQDKQLKLETRQNELDERENNINIWTLHAEENTKEILKECEKVEKNRFYIPDNIQELFQKIKKSLIGAWNLISELRKKNEKLEKDLNDTKQHLDNWRNADCETLENMTREMRGNNVNSWNEMQTKKKAQKKQRYNGISMTD